MWELDYKESWTPKNWCFWTVVLEKTLVSPLDCKEIQPVHSKGDQSWISTGRTDVGAETPILCHLMQRTDLLKKTQFISVQSISCVQLFATPWTVARQASLSITNSRNLLRFMSIELVMPSNHLILCHPLLLLPSIFPSIRVFSNESVLCIRWQSIGVSVSASLLPRNIQEWFPSA